MKIQKLGVNYCHCPCCHTEFFFDEGDIYLEEYTRIPEVVCPYCRKGLNMGFHNNCFTYKKMDEE